MYKAVLDCPQDRKHPQRGNCECDVSKNTHVEHQFRQEFKWSEKIASVYASFLRLAESTPW